MNEKRRTIRHQSLGLLNHVTQQLIVNYLLIVYVFIRLYIHMYKERYKTASPQCTTKITSCFCQSVGPKNLIDSAACDFK